MCLQWDSRVTGQGRLKGDEVNKCKKIYGRFAPKTDRLRHCDWCLLTHATFDTLASTLTHHWPDTCATWYARGWVFYHCVSIIVYTLHAWSLSVAVSSLRFTVICLCSYSKNQRAYWRPVHNTHTPLLVQTCTRTYSVKEQEEKETPRRKRQAESWGKMSKQSSHPDSWGTKRIPQFSAAGHFPSVAMVIRI